MKSHARSGCARTTSAGRTDQTVFVHHGRDLKAASANPDSELWIVPGCDHVEAFSEHPEEWQQHVLTFLDRELAKAPTAAR